MYHIVFFSYSLIITFIQPVAQFLDAEGQHGMAHTFSLCPSQSTHTTHIVYSGRTWPGLMGKDPRLCTH